MILTFLWIVIGIISFWMKVTWSRMGRPRRPWPSSSSSHYIGSFCQVNIERFSNCFLNFLNPEIGLLFFPGTPIQNSVLELWSLFDFLMPGFLGTEKQFSQKFSRPIIASRDSKSSSKDQEAGALAMEALHRQVRKIWTMHPRLHLFIAST